MLKIAIKMLFRDYTKFITLFVAIAFSTALILQQGSIFVGLLRHFSTTIRITQAPIWVMHESTERVDTPTPIPEVYLGQVKSIDGVEWAYPYIINVINAKIENGNQDAVQLVGVDDETLFGLPNAAIKGQIKDIYSPDAVVVDKNNLSKLGNPELGDTFEMNDQKARVVAIIDIPRNPFSYPFVYTTYDRAKNYLPPQRNVLSFILAKPQKGYTTKQVIKNIEENTELIAFSQDEYFNLNIDWVMKNTGIPINFGISVMLGVLVGLSIVSQTFYAFIAENTKYLATLRAIGTSNWTLVRMVSVQSALVGFIGFSLGIGVVSIFGSTVPKVSKLVFYTPYQLFFITLGFIFLICIASSLLSLKRVIKIEPATVFRD